MRSSAPSYLHKSRCPSPVLRGGRSFGIARHWHPVLKIYIIPFITSRSSTGRLLPPRLAGGINGSTSAHSSSVRSLGYRNALRSYRPRFFAVHIGDPPSNQATTLESQTIQKIQYVLGQTLNGAPPAKRIALIVWDSIEQAQAYYDSAAYKALIPNRDKASKFRAFV